MVMDYIEAAKLRGEKIVISLGRKFYQIALHLVAEFGLEFVLYSY